MSTIVHLRPVDAVFDAAMTYAADGTRIFPCHPATKKPMVKWGSQSSCDPRQIETWWRRWPNAMIGMPTGRNIGCFVVDLDPGVDLDTGEMFDIKRLLVDLERAIGGSLPMTIAARTPRSGLHLFFRTPAGLTVTNSPGHLPKRIDVRGQGGYVIAAPSIRSDGQHYLWINEDDQELAVAPRGLIDVLGLSPPANLVA